jgi:acyl-CoA hydrolase
LRTPVGAAGRLHDPIFVAKLADGIVTPARAEADLMVTEYGIAELCGRTLAERVRALVAVADPAFRAELEQASQRLV